MGFIGDMLEENAKRKRRQREQMRDFLGGIPPGFWYGLILLVGIIMLGFGLWQSVDYAESRDWPAAAGKIIQSQLRSETRTERNRSGTRTYTYYFAQIRYEYRVNGVRYESERVRLSEKMCILTLCTSDVRAASDPADPQERLANYPVNKTVQVRYNPADPQEAVLERNISVFIFFSLGMGAFMMIIGAVLLALPGQRTQVAPEEAFWEEKRRNR